MHILLRSIWLMLLVFQIAWAKDVVIITKPDSHLDRRDEYANRLLVQALHRTEAKYGAFELRESNYAMERGRLTLRSGQSGLPEFRTESDRLLYEMKRGEFINVSTQATRLDWERELIPVRIPIDKGLFSYRIFLIRKADQGRFSAIHNLHELKQLRVGVGDVWSIYQVLKAAGFNTVAGAGYEPLFDMLNNGRFDYFSRALYEAPIELRDRQTRYPEMVIEKGLATYSPQPRYFFVSPAMPKLAKRIQEGLLLMLKDGSFDRLLADYYRPLIEETGFCRRRVFRFDNPFLTPETPLAQEDLWLDPRKPLKGGGKPLCPG